ncbi:MAG: chemotaxis protein CheW [Rhodospirillaceae bacterium]|nr:chemotaxis protein CheW [Rhodospirillaceae bacterium]
MDSAEERGDAPKHKKIKESDSASDSNSDIKELSAVEEVKSKKQDHMMAVTVEHHNELYTLLVDSVGDVIPLSKESYEGNPSTLDPLWREFAGGVYRLEGRLMVVLDVERLLDFRAKI